MLWVVSVFRFYLYCSMLSKIYTKGTEIWKRFDKEAQSRNGFGVIYLPLWCVFYLKALLAFSYENNKGERN